jgi:hypothetical protein
LEALFVRWTKLGFAVDVSQIHWRKRPGMRAIANLPVVPDGHGAAGSMMVRSQPAACWDLHLADNFLCTRR